MGIKGLLVGLKDIMEQVHLSEFRGLTAAIDGFSWLHKGVYCCSTDLVLGKPTQRYFYYNIDIGWILAHICLHNIFFDLSIKPTSHSQRQFQYLTTRYVKYVLDKVRMLKAFDVKPYMVFDGDCLPMKKKTEDKRAKSVYVRCYFYFLHTRMCGVCGENA